MAVCGYYSSIHPVVTSYVPLPAGLLALDITPPLGDRPVQDNETVVLVAHGLTGGSHESYVRSALTVLTGPTTEGGLGLRAIVLNSRGCNNSPVITPKLYHVCSVPHYNSSHAHEVARGVRQVVRTILDRWSYGFPRRFQIAVYSA